MDLQQMGAIANIGCFVLGGLTLLFTLRPLPWKRNESTIPFPKGVRFALLVMALGFCISGITIWLAWANQKPTVKDWEYDFKSLEIVTGKNFANQEVELDNKRISDSKIKNATFVYKGNKPYVIADNEISSSLHIKILMGPAASGAMLVSGTIGDLCRGKEANCDIRGLTIEVVDEEGKVVTDLK